MNILDCNQYHNPLNTPYACITFFDSLIIFALIVIVFLIVMYFIYKK